MHPRNVAKFMENVVEFVEFPNCGRKASWAGKCHIFNSKNSQNTSSKVQYIAGETMNTENVFGPVCFLNGNKSIFYPCDSFKCYIGCPCHICQIKTGRRCKNENCLQEVITSIIKTSKTTNKTKVKKVKVTVPGYYPPKEPWQSSSLVNPAHISFPDSGKPTPPAWYWKDWKEMDTSDEETDKNIKCQDCQLDVKDHKKFHRSTHTDCIFCKRPRDIPVKAFMFKHISYTKSAKDFNSLKCNHCDMDFKDDANVHRHIKSVHYQEKEYCQECDIHFSRKDLLDRHITEKHNNETIHDFECSKCETKFTRKYHLERHEQKAKGSICDVCNASFCLSKDLFKHIRIYHKNISCEVCGKSFSRISSVERHRRDQVLVNCQKCEKIFCTKFDLKIHKKKNHPEEDEK